MPAFYNRNFRAGPAPEQKNHSFSGMVFAGETIF